MGDQATRSPACAQIWERSGHATSRCTFRYLQQASPDSSLDNVMDGVVGRPDTTLHTIRSMSVTVQGALKGQLRMDSRLIANRHSSPPTVSSPPSFCRSEGSMSRWDIHRWSRGTQHRMCLWLSAGSVVRILRLVDATRRCPCRARTALLRASGCSCLFQTTYPVLQHNLRAVV